MPCSRRAMVAIFSKMDFGTKHSAQASGVALLVAGALVLLSYGSRYRVGRLLAADWSAIASAAGRHRVASRRIGPEAWRFRPTPPAKIAKPPRVSGDDLGRPSRIVAARAGP